MKNLKVGAKLMVSFGIVMALFIIAIVLSLLSITNINNQITNFYEGAYSVRGQVKDVKENFEAMQKYTFRALSNSDPTITNESVQKSRDAATNIQNLMPQIKESFAKDSGANDQLIVDLEGYLSQLAPLQDEVLSLAAENKNAAAGLYMENNNIPVIEKAVATINQIIDYVNGNGEKMMKSLESVQASTLVLLIVVGVGCLLLCLVLCAYMTRSLTQPINEMKTVAGEMAQGNLRVDITYHSQDEIGEMADGLRQMISTLRAYIDDIAYGMREIGQGNLNINPSVEFKGDFIALRDSIVHVIFSLNETIQKIQESANQVSTGSDQVSSGAQSLSQGATEQASSVQELAATINDISTQVKSNADNAAQASELADSVGQMMTESNQQMQSMIQAMSDISGSSTEIAKIIKTIEDIAFQTNILALNAAVEAARAGAAGKGFAVVADEVRNLASKSADASKSTASLIETSVRSVENGTKIVNQTASSLVEAVDGAKKVSATINKISQASETQAAAIGQVTQGVDQISSVIQTNSATAEESAASSEELSSQAQILKGLVSRFQLRDEAVPAATLQNNTARSSQLKKPVPPAPVSHSEPAPLPAHISLGDDDKY